MKPETEASINRYVEHGVPTGSFLRAFLANDLMEAVGRADEENMRDFREIAQYVYNDIPAPCHGSYEIVDKWIAEHQRKASASNA